MPSASPNATAVEHVGARVAGEARPPHREQHERGDAEPQQRRSRGPDLVEQRDGERRPDLEGRDGDDDERDPSRVELHLRPATTDFEYAGSALISASVKRIGSHCSCEKSRVWSA